jgi:cytidylate kinase
MNPSTGLSSPLVIVGLHSSGKTTLARALGFALNAQVFELGFGVHEAAQSSGRDVLVEVAYELLRDDPLYLARSAVERAGPELRHGIFVGPRTQAELDFLVSRLAPVTVGLYAAHDYRLERWRHRHLKYADKWDRRESQEQDWGTSKLVKGCQLILNAADDLEVKQKTVLGELER